LYYAGNVCLGILYNYVLLETFFHLDKLRVTFDMRAEIHVGLQVKCPSLLSDLNQYWNMSTNFNKALNITFIKLRSMVLELADGQKDMAKLTRAFIATFRCERAKNVAVINQNQD
jgi:hypothetical protein